MINSPMIRKSKFVGYTKYKIHYLLWPTFEQHYRSIGYSWMLNSKYYIVIFDLMI